MIRRILVLLGETPSSLCARKYAMRLAQETHAGIAGFAGIDLPFINAHMPGRVGSSAYQVRLEEQLRKQADEREKRVHLEFARECTAHNLPFEPLSFEGDANEALQLALETTDLCVTGHDTAFHGNVRERLPDMLCKLSLKAPRPLIVCPDECPPGHDILVAYDGTSAAMRAIQLFVLLKVAHGSRIHITSVNVSEELAVHRVGAAATYLRNHGYEVDCRPIETKAHASEVIRTQIANLKIGTLVMGAYGNRHVREFLFGSTTTKFLEDPPSALFLYH